MNWSVENHFQEQIDGFAFDDVLSCCIYGNLPRTIVYKMKMQGSPYIARAVAKLLAERISLAQKEDDLKVDLLIPVPCTKKKKLKRGFNQAELLSNYTSKLTGIPVNTSLTKIKETRQAKESTGIARRFMHQGTFDVLESEIKNISNMNILIVDDVITTGSTADECARVLKAAGAKWVGVLCFASCSEV